MALKVRRRWEWVLKSDGTQGLRNGFKAVASINVPILSRPLMVGEMEGGKLRKER